MPDVLLLLAILLVAVRPVGEHIARAMSGERTWLHPVFGPVERLIYRACGIDPEAEMPWLPYALSLLLLSLLGFLALYALLLAQHHLPLNPEGMPGLSPDLAFNAAISFVTNTNWQSYSGEAAISPFVQAAGMTVQNFLSAAVGLAAAAALFRAFTRRQQSGIGNAWADLTRALLYVLLPLSLLFALLLASQGVVQDAGPYVTAATLEGGEQRIAVGPAASQVAIKMLGSNGGGYFNANSAHPFENPTPFSNLLQMLAIFLLPVALIHAFGVMVGDRRQGVALLAASLLLFMPVAAVAIWQESQANPAFALPGVEQQGNLEGKEVRFGAEASAFWAVATTATSNGSVNAMHDSFLPLGGMMPLLSMMFGEVVFGGVGAGMIGLLVFVIITVFLGGLMVGRTPEYLGKKLGPFEIKMASIVILISGALALLGAAIAAATQAGQAGLLNPGAQGFSEMLYAATSAANNNGSAFAGLSANTPFYNILLGILMFVGRFFVIIPVLAIAGSLAARNTVPQSPGTLPTHTPLFVLMLVSVILIVGVLTYAPALALGPVAEHLRLFAAGAS